MPEERLLELFADALSSALRPFAAACVAGRGSPTRYCERHDISSSDVGYRFPRGGGHLQLGDFGRCSPAAWCQELKLLADDESSVPRRSVDGRRVAVDVE